MRISDWSSDVCSSDLRPLARMPTMPPEDLNAAALEYHEFPRPGKLSVELTKRTDDARDLSLAYSPGAAAPVRAIAENPRSDERRVGQECVSKCRSRGPRYHDKKKKRKEITEKN